MILNLIHSARVGDKYLILAPIDLFWLAVLALGALAVASAYLANRPQPRPLTGLWALSKVDREVRARSRE